MTSSQRHRDGALFLVASQPSHEGSIPGFAALEATYSNPGRMLPLASPTTADSSSFEDLSCRSQSTAAYVLLNPDPSLPTPFRFPSCSTRSISTLLFYPPSPSQYSLLERISRRRTGGDYNRTAAENGWVPRAHEEEERIRQEKDEAGDRYKANQQEALDQWVVWVPDSDEAACLRGHWPSILL